MSCRHDLATGTCNRCYPNTGTIEPGPEEEYEPNMEGIGAVTAAEYQAAKKKNEKKTSRPWPRNTSCFPCACLPTAKRGTHCTGKVVRCNARLEAIREWMENDPPFDGADPANSKTPSFNSLMNTFGLNAGKATIREVVNQDIEGLESVQLEEIKKILPSKETRNLIDSMFKARIEHLLNYNRDCSHVTRAKVWLNTVIIACKEHGLEDT
jgi:hypothetical protein